MLHIAILLISVLVIKMALIKFLKKKYSIVPDPGEYIHMNNTHKWGERGLIQCAIIFLIISFFSHRILFLYFFVITLCIGLGFRTFMEYKYEREQGVYIITFIETIGVCIMIIGASILYYV